MSRFIVACAALKFAVCLVLSMITVARGADDFEKARAKTISGEVLDTESEVRLLIKPKEKPGRFYDVKEFTNRRFKQQVKLFPGWNKATAKTATGLDPREITLKVAKPFLRVELSWAGNNQDYDLHVKNVNDVYYSNKVSDGGTLDHDWISNDSEGNPTEIIKYPAAEAGLYRICVYYFADNEHNVNKEDVGYPQPTTVRIYVNNDKIFDETYTITEHNGNTTENGKSIWNVGTVVLHAGMDAGGYAVDGRFLDVTKQRALRGVSPRTTYSVENLTGPNGTDPYYMIVGEAAQFTATGTLNAGSGNQQPNLEIIEKFSSSDQAVGTIDALGVFIAKSSGLTQISCEGYSGSAIDVHVLDVMIAVELEDPEPTPTNTVRTGLNENTLKFELNGKRIPKTELTLLKLTERVGSDNIVTSIKVSYKPSYSELYLSGDNTVKIDIDDMVGNHMDQRVHTFQLQ
jgi:hypothetical protein